MRLQELDISIDPSWPGRVPSDDRVIAELERQLAGRQVGLMYTYVHDADVGTGEAKAKVVNDLVAGRREPVGPSQITRLADVRRLFDGAVLKDGGDRSPPAGRVDFEIYLKVSNCE